ncbi:ApeA N-terminal domain 1-containing protein [Tsukamurella soli]|uniref:ApeA N-terminal domain-containing protein n=1 Tax=Tsukamurella soli TaxID=644556 RepID=A0ABP8JDW0_9ACTN
MDQVYEGYWWVPTAADERIPGVLTIAPTGRAELNLIGAFLAGYTPQEVGIMRNTPVA